MHQAAEKIPHQDPDATTDPRRLRVAIFSDSFPERNGAGAYYSDLSVQLRPELEALEMFQPVVKKRMLRFALPLPGDSTQKLITPNIFRLTRQFRELRPNLVIAVTPGPFGLLGLYLAKRSRTGFITAFHTHFEGLVRMYGNSLFFRVAFWYLEQVNKILCRASKTVLINNEHLEATVARLGAKNVDIMGTPLSRAFLEPPLKHPPGTLETVIFAGRLAPEKNLPAVMEAVKALPGIRFVIAGEGPLRAKLEAEAATLPNLRLTGWLDREALCRELDEASLLLLPSHMETFGTVALEAMARGRPALVAENAGIHNWKILEDSLFTLRKDESLADTLRKLSGLPAETWAAKATAARSAAESLHHQTIDQWVGFVSRYSRPLPIDPRP